MGSSRFSSGRSSAAPCARITRNLRRLVGLNTNAVDETVLNKLVDGELVEFFRLKGLPAEAIAQIQIGGFPQELLLYSQLLEQDIREASGQSLMDRGQRINVETATEASGVAQGSSELAQRIQSAFEDFTTDVMRFYMQGRRATMSEPELVPLLGFRDAARAAEAFLTVNPEALAEEYDYQVVPGSMLPRDHDRDAQRATADLQVASGAAQIHNLPFLYERYWSARGIDPGQAFLSPEQTESMRAAVAGGRVLPEEGGASGRGGGIDPMLAAFGKP